MPAALAEKRISTEAGTHQYVSLLGLRTFDLPEIIRAIERGLPFNAIERLHRNVGLDIDEIATMVITLVFAGQDSTRCSLGHALATFAAHPEQWELLECIFG